MSTRWFLPALTILLLTSCRPYYPLLFSLDSELFSKSLKYNENGKELSVKGDFSPAGSVYLFIKIKHEGIDPDTVIINNNTINIDTNFDMDERIDIRHNLREILAFLYIYLPDSSKATKGDLKEYLASKYLIINIKNVFSETLKIHVKLDEKNLIKWQHQEGRKKLSAQ